MSRHHLKSPSKILFICSPLVGRFRSVDTLAKRLQLDGHTVVLAVPPQLLKYLGTSSLETREIEHFRLGGLNGGSPSGLRDFLPSARRNRLSGLANELNIAPVKQLIDCEAPDLVVIDYEMHPHIIAAVGTSKPVALFTDHFITQPSGDCPPLHTVLVPGHDTSFAIWRAWIRIWLKLRRKRIKAWIATGGTDYLSLLKHMAKSQGFRLQNHTTHWWWQAPCFWRSVPLVIAQSPALDFPANYDGQLRHIGPMVPPTTPSQMDDEVREFALRAKYQGKRVVYISFGTTFKAKPDVVWNTWSAIEACEDVVAIQSTGGRGDFEAEDVPKNVLLVNWVEQGNLLNICDAAIMHGGVNTLIECIETSTPMLSIPDRVDQPGTTARIVYHGLGLKCSKKSTAEEIKKSLRCLLDDPSYHKRCAEMRSACKALEHDMTAETVFRELLDRSEPRAQPILYSQRNQ